MSTVTQTPGGDMTETTRGGGKGLAIGLGIGAVALVGGGTAAAMMFLGGGGEQPDSVMPDTVAAYARVDMDPEAGQKVAAVRFFRGLDPEVTERLESGEWREWAWEQATKNAEEPLPLDFEQDIEPWLGDRLGIGMLPPAAEGEEPQAIVALQVKDGDAALAAMDKLKAEGEGEGDAPEYYIDGDYLVLVGEGQADAVRAAADAGSLADLDTYSSDMDDLGDEGIASYWYDMEALMAFAGGAEMVDNAAELGAPAMASDLSSALTEEQLEMVKGRGAGSVRLSADAIEVYGIARGTEANGFTLAPTGDSPRIVNELPADTVAAFSLENGSALVDSVWAAVTEMDPEGTQQMVDEAAAAGFNLPEDIKAVLGDSMSLSVGPGLVEAFNSMPGTDTGMPALPIAYRVHSDGNRLSTLLADAGLPPTALAQRTDESVLTLGLHQPYVDGVAAADEQLGDKASYKAAVADIDNAASVFYVDVNEFEKHYLPLVEDQKARDALQTLGAVGYSAVVTEDNESHYTLRFVADEE